MAVTELELRNKVVSVMRGWLGYSEANGKFKAIIDLYNTQRPLPRGYAVQYDDEWCATTVTAAGIQAGLHDIIFGECSCSKMIELYRAKGQWMESDAYRPEPGDIVMYDWQDTGKGDNTGGADHVGIVEKVVGNTITVIEGNKGEAVAHRTLTVNGRYIRGYCLPDYASKAEAEEDDDKIRLWQVFLEDCQQPVEFDWIWETYYTEHTNCLLEWELALHMVLEKLGFQVERSKNSYRLVDGAGQERRFDFARGGSAEKLFLKLLFPVDAR